MTVRVYLLDNKTARAHEARRADRLSARLVRITGTAAPSTIPGGIGMGQIRELLDQHVCGSKVRSQKDIRITCHLRFDAFGQCSFLGNCIIESQRSVKNCTLDLAALCHLAQNGRINGGNDFGVHRLDGGQNTHLRRFDPQHIGKANGILNDMRLVGGIREDVDDTIGGSAKGFGLGRHTDHKNVADTTIGAQATITADNRCHQFVGV